MSVPLAGHLRQVLVSVNLLLGALDSWLRAPDVCLDYADVTASACLLNTVLDLLPGQELPLVHDSFIALLEPLAKRAELLGCLLVLVRMDILICHVVPHPVDVERAWLVTDD